MKYMLCTYRFQLYTQDTYYVYTLTRNNNSRWKLLLLSSIHAIKSFSAAFNIFFYFFYFLSRLLSYLMPFFTDCYIFFCIVLKRPFLSFLNSIELKKSSYLILTCELKPFLIFFSSTLHKKFSLFGISK